LLEALNRTLCDVMGNQKPFGGIALLMAGDFRQILPVIRHGRRADIIDAALSRSQLWSSTIVVKLHHNVRVEKCARDDEHLMRLRQHADWLIKLGAGKLPTNDDGNIVLPSELCVSTTNNLYSSSSLNWRQSSQTKHG